MDVFIADLLSIGRCVNTILFWGFHIGVILYYITEILGLARPRRDRRRLWGRTWMILRMEFSTLKMMILPKIPD